MEIRIPIPEGYEIDEKKILHLSVSSSYHQKKTLHMNIYVKGFLKEKFSTLSGTVILNGGIAKMMRWLIRIILQMRINLKDYQH